MDFQPAFETDNDDILSSETYYNSLKIFQDKNEEIKKKEQEILNKKNKAEQYSNTNSTSILSKSFVADTGIRYIWDEEDQDWIEADDDYDEKDVFSDEEEGDLNFNSKKRGFGEINQDSNNNEVKTETRKRKRKNKNKNKAQAHWVYITGLPPDVTSEELNEHFSKVGIIAMNPYDQTKKIKIYKDEDGDVKGDGSIFYVSIDSVKMAIDILHEGYLRPNCMVTVSKAEFNVPTVNTSTGDSGSTGNTSKSTSTSAATRPIPSTTTTASPKRVIAAE